MVQLSTREDLHQELMGATSARQGQVLWVDSNNGNDGNPGADPRHALLTLTRALAMSEAGDTIRLAPGGSETVTTSLAMNKARVKVICEVSSPRQGFELNGATSLDLLTCSAGDCHVEGLHFSRVAGAGATTAGLLTTAAADRLTVKNCFFDDSAVTSSWVGYGIEVTNACQGLAVLDCLFIDHHRSVIFVNTDTAQIGTLVEGWRLWHGSGSARF